MSKWIPVDERLPETGERVIVVDFRKFVISAVILDGQWRAYYASGQKVIEANVQPTHWQPLPAPPEGK